MRRHVADIADFDLAGDLPRGLCVIEASAGTGKTYTLTALVVRYIVEEGMTADQLLMVTFTRAAASEMRQRTRDAIALVLETVETGRPPKDQWVRAIVENERVTRGQKLRRLEKALRELDLATITTIHGFCQQLLRRVGFRAGDAASGEVDAVGSEMSSQLLRDRLIQILADDPGAFGTSSEEARPDLVEKNLGEVISQLSTNQGARIAPSTSTDVVVQRWRDTADEIRKSAQERRLRTGSIDFDDLIVETDRVLRDPTTGPGVKTMLREQYKVVMIDEFQDTDSLQWGIFRDLYVEFDDSAEKPVVVCVGDPKQAIYRFRGADIDAYLRALATSSATKYTIRRNFRTDKVIVEAMNTLMDDLDLGRGMVRYVQVEAARETPPAALTGAAPFEVRWLAQDVDLGSGKQKADEVRRHIANDLAEHVSRLLRDCTIKSVQNGVESERPIVPMDIAILVRANGDAAPLQLALAERGILSVRNKIGAVVQSEAMEQMRILADALYRPSDLRRVRALLLSWFLQPSVHDLEGSEGTAMLQDQCRLWAGELSKKGIAGFFEWLRAETDVLTSIASVGDFDRNITDLEHLVELVHRVTKGAPMSAGVLRRVLADLAADHEERDEHLRRTESDSAAVQIMSMHGSKGLEFPVVLLPYPKQLNNRSPYVYTVADARYVDAAPTVDWAEGNLDRETRKRLAEQEIAEDERRLIYVAMTRARNHLVIWWATTQGVSKGSMASVLFRSGRHDLPATAPKSDADQLEVLQSLQDRIGASMLLSRTPAVVSVTPYVRPPAPATELAVSGVPINSRSRRDWYRWSFSSLNSSSRVAESEKIRGGDDEFGLSDSGHRDQGDAESINGPLMAMPRSAWFGSLIHDVMEHVDFISPSIRDDLQKIIERRHGANIPGVSIDALAEGLALSVATPLHGIAAGIRLADLALSERRNEMEFHLPIVDGRRSLPSRVIADIASEMEGGEVGAHFASLAAAWGGATISGIMVGSIDAFLRIDRRYFVVDYKSNALHPSDRQAAVLDYMPESMAEEMRHHNYYLQALLYSVGAHRYLRHRVKKYDPEVHLGGSGYLFVRGMIGPTTPVRDGIACGVYGWRPAIETVERVDRFLSGQGGD